MNESSNAVAVRVEGFRKTFHTQRPALNNINFTIREGERVALLGASGSGKSTLLRCLCALETGDAGAGGIELFGKSLQRHGKVASDVRALRRQVGIVFQQFNLVGRLPVMSNVLTGLAAEVPLWRSVTGRFSVEEQALALDALASIGLGPQAFQRASTLSGGQQQRAAIARVLVQGASLLLADEPVASLDPESTRVVMELLLSLNQTRAMTLVVSLHHVGLARRYCERVIALRDGEMVFDGPTSALTPAFTQSLYGQAASELLEDLEEGSSVSHAVNPVVAGAVALADS